VVEISERMLRLAKDGGWVGVDLDGTMFTYDDWVPWNVFGEPIKPMIDRIKAWLAAGVGVRIVTARIGLPLYMGHTPTLSNHPWNTCRVTGEKFSDANMALAIGRHCQKHGLPCLPVQCYKDINMIEFWDDRAIQVIANTGRTLAEEHAAELAAQQGKQFLEEHQGG
jgi:hypothetical protein